MRSPGKLITLNLGRSGVFADSVLSIKERGEVFDGLMNRCRRVEVFYAWRPNLPDEADNHLIEWQWPHRPMPSSRAICGMLRAAN